MKKRALLAVVLAIAAFNAEAIFALDSHPLVIDNVTFDGSRWSYDFSISNPAGTFGIAPPIYGYYVPFFADAAVAGLTAPAGWTVEILAQNRFNLAEAGVLHWAATTFDASIQPNEIQTGFRYSAAYGPAKAPFEVVLSGNQSVFGDPAIPGSPAALRAGLPMINAVPEPGTWALAVVGLMGVVAARKRKPVVEARST